MRTSGMTALAGALVTAAAGVGCGGDDAKTCGANPAGYAPVIAPADFPTSRWPTTRYVRDDHDLVFQPAPLPPGEYRLVVGLWNAGTGERLGLVSAAETFANGIVLPTRITVRP